MTTFSLARRPLGRYASARVLAARIACDAAVAVVPFLASLGLGVVTTADALSRSVHSHAELVLWPGLLLIVVPIGVRVAMSSCSRTERIVLVLLLGVMLYLAKVVHDPFGFTYADELVHARNANAIRGAHTLFGDNSILPVTARYPGLESVTAAFSLMSGVGTFAAGLVVIGIARVVLTLALYLLFERVSGSSRVAALGVVFYAANPNFVFFSAQFSYESFALPLAIVAVAASAEGAAATGRERRCWLSVATVAALAVVVSHHMTSYALVALLAAVTAAYALVGRRGDAPWLPLGVATAAAVGWLAVVAHSTLGYIVPVLARAFASSLRTFAGESHTRTLFHGGGTSVPPLDHVTGLAAAAIALLLAAVGGLAVRKRYRREPFALVFAAAGGCYFATLLLRLVPAAWESANRASEFLFLGLAFLLALGATTLLVFGSRAGIALLSIVVAVMFAGGIVAGWPPSLRVAQPYRVDAGNGWIEPQPRALAAWFSTALPARARVAASDADARMLLAYADAHAVAGVHPDVTDLLRSTTLEPWQLPLLRANRLEYVAVDRRDVAFDAMAGYYFGSGAPEDLLPRGVSTKFAAHPHAFDRLWDGGTLAVYDIGARR